MKKKTILSIALAGSVLFASMSVPPSTAVASDNRPLMYYLASQEAPGEGYYYRLEPNSISNFDLEGFHYVSAWVVNIYKNRIGDGLFPGLGGLIYEKCNFGYLNVLIKYRDDGSVISDYIYYQKKPKDYKEQTAAREDSWRKALINKYSEKNDELAMEHKGEDIFNPNNWHSDRIAPNDMEFANEKVKSKAAQYIKRNYPDIVSNNIAMNKRDEAKIIMQRQSAYNAKIESERNQQAAIANQMHSQITSEYQKKTNRNVNDVLHGLGNYNWDMFLNSSATSMPVDVNTLIKNVWYMDYVGPNNVDGPDGYTRTINRDGYRSIVYFKPVIWVNKNTSEILWKESLLEVNMLYRAYNNEKPQSYQYETFILELERGNGQRFSPNISVMPSDTPDKGGEKTIYFGHEPTEGDFKTVNAAPYYYVYKAGWSSNDFWLMEYYSTTDQPTQWGYHFTKKIN